MTGPRGFLSRVGSRLREGAGSRGPDDERLRRDLTRKEREVRELRVRLAATERALKAARTEAERAAEAAGRLSGGDVPVFFLVGRAKSGTSWLRDILNQHPDVLCVNEGRFFGRGYVGFSETAPKRSLYGALAESEYLTDWLRKSPWSRDEDMDAQVRGLTRATIDRLLARRLAKTGKKIIGDKTPFISAGVVEEIAEIHPDARVVHIIRDGRDVAVSSAHHLWNSAKDGGGSRDLDPAVLAKRDAYRADPDRFVKGGESLFAPGQLAELINNTWAPFVGRAIEDGPRLLGENYAEVRYEDLLERPVEETRRLLAFLGADAGEEEVARYVEASSFERMSSRRRGEEDSASFFRKGVAGDWRNVFTEEDRRVFKEAAGDLLVRLGYEQDDDW